MERTYIKREQMRWDLNNLGAEQLTFVYFAGGKRRTIPFRRQRMQIDQSIPPSGIASAPQMHTEDPYYLDLLNVADDRYL